MKAAFRTKQRKTITIIELIIVSMMAVLILLPIAAAMGAIVREWSRSREIKRLQEEVDRAAYFIKGVLEEAYGYQQESFPAERITLTGPQEGSGQVVTIKAEGGSIIIENGDAYAVIDRLDDMTLIFEPCADNPALIMVKIEALRGEKDINNSFSVLLRNY